MESVIQERLSNIPECFIWNRRFGHIWRCWVERENTRTIKGTDKEFCRKEKVTATRSIADVLIERFLERLAKSSYKNNFILKGGFLISSMIGISERTTMDMDTTITGINMEEDELERVIREILLIDVGDGIKFEFEKFEIIREKDDYSLKSSLE